ncbi:mannosyl-3-phosphoglycerate phosphatase [Luteitalea sp. TBR-22]|uniref:HAD-IIB family hydrolase n=1 Tax=Luteitalea sp. TBR-22 TaxID=2802971 RepID=UPI001EF6A767|nr:HAD-IIB family hydrolase [Luteitalea sp. TBR-22]
MRLIFTDLDGTLLDHHTYSAEPAREALEACRVAGVPVVPCSSKTFAEMRALARALALAPAPLLVENGSMVWFPRDWPAVPTAALPTDDGWQVVLGTRADLLRDVLERVAATVGGRLRPIADMPVEEVVSRTGLSPATAALAMAREFSQPFLVDGDDPPLSVLDAAARVHGARVTRGGRFFHLLGPTDKGAAVAVVRATCPAGHRALGLGDAPNDLPLLQAVDDPAVVPQPDSGLHPALVQALTSSVHAPCAGPAGWSAVVLDWLARTGPSA